MKISSDQPASSVVSTFEKNVGGRYSRILKSHYRGCRYASETIKLLPQKPDGILLAEIFEHIARLDMVHPVFQPVSTTWLS